jgi:hypothetical protein
MNEVLSLDVGGVDGEPCTVKEFEDAVVTYKDGLMFLHDCYLYACDSAEDFQEEFPDAEDVPFCTTEAFVKLNAKALRVAPDLAQTGVELGSACTQSLLALYGVLDVVGQQPTPESFCQGKTAAAVLAKRLEELLC